MAILAAGSLQNVYASLDRYCQEQLSDAAGLSVKLHGVRRFVPPTDAPWVEIAYNFLGMQAQHHRQIYEGVVGTSRIGHLQVSIFQRARIFAQRYTTAQARDTVVAAFPEGSIIEVYGYSDVLPDMEPAIVGAIVLHETTEQVLDDGMESGVTQHVLTIQTRYLEHFTRA